MATLTNPDAVGMDPEKLEQVKQLFHAQLEQGLHPGAGLAVYRSGHLVLDIHGGVSDVRGGGGATQPVISTTMFVLMSSTKPLAADVSTCSRSGASSPGMTPASQDWPEFGQHGKETDRHPVPRVDTPWRVPRDAQGPAPEVLGRMGQSDQRHGTGAGHLYSGRDDGLSPAQTRVPDGCSPPG